MSQDKQEQTKRANPDRIDFYILSSGISVTKFDHIGDRSIPWEKGSRVKEWGKVELDQAIAWCEENNYIVRRWPSGDSAFTEGARAFKGELFAIRTEGQMKRMRRRLEAQGKGFFFDLRYDL